LRRRRDPVPRQLVAASVVAVMGISAFGIIRMGVAENRGNALAEELEANEDFVVDPDDLGGGDASGPPSSTTPVTQPVSTSTPVSSPESTSTTSSTTTTTTSLPEGSPRVLAIGDSVMKGAADVLGPRGWTVVAQESLQM